MTQDTYVELCTGVVVSGMKSYDFVSHKVETIGDTWGDRDVYETIVCDHTINTP